MRVSASYPLFTLAAFHTSQIVTLSQLAVTWPPFSSHNSSSRPLFSFQRCLLKSNLSATLSSRHFAWGDVEYKTSFILKKTRYKETKQVWADFFFSGELTLVNNKSLWYVTDLFNLQKWYSPRFVREFTESKIKQF